MASSLKCERGTDRRTLASDAMSRVIFGPGDLDAEELDVPAAAQLELDTSLSFCRAGTSFWIEATASSMSAFVSAVDIRRAILSAALGRARRVRAMHATTPAVAAVFEPVQAVTTFEETVERLGTAIRLGLLPPGAQLPPERDLAEQLGISRSTLRQALTALTQSGHLVAVRGRGGGWFVADPLPRPRPSRSSWRRGASCSTTAIAVEVGVVVLAAERAGADDLARLSATSRRCAR